MYAFVSTSVNTLLVKNNICYYDNFYKRVKRTQDVTITNTISKPNDEKLYSYNYLQTNSACLPKNSDEEIEKKNVGYEKVADHEHTVDPD